MHIPKNAGRSIEAALLGGNGSPDGGRRSLVNRTATLISRCTAPRFAKTHLIGTLDVTLAAQHLTFVEMEMLGLLPENNDYISFCVVRNPYDRALSSVMHFSRAEWKASADDEERRSGFERDLEAWLNAPLTDHNLRAHRRSQVDFLHNRKGEIAVDHILRFESIGKEFSALSDGLGWTGVGIERVGDSGRRRTYLDYYTEGAKVLVERYFAADLDAFKFVF